MTDLPDLARKWNRALEKGKGIRMEGADLDLLAAIGVNDLIQAKAAQMLKEQSEERTAKRMAKAEDETPGHSRAVNSRCPSPRKPREPSPSDAIAASERLKRILGAKKGKSRGKWSSQKS